MSTQKERAEFMALLVREYPAASVYVVCEFARKLMRHATTHGRLAVEQCNGPQWLNVPSPYHWERQADQHKAWQADNSAQMAQWENDRQRKEDACERRMTELCAPFGLVPHFGGDPRGYTVKLKLPSGKSNTWGGSEEGWAVPQ